MTEKITREVFDHMVALAALELSEDDAVYLLKELNSQLQAIEELAAIPLDESVELAAHGVPYTPEISSAVREDIPTPFANPEEIVAGAPETKDGFFVVPDIPTEDLT
ncbi:Asp-tRNA(Asn)/Glu-tRNA(Gln) amidotransferase subunit GatC [Chloroflexota bacterium]